MGAVYVFVFTGNLGNCSFLCTREQIDNMACNMGHQMFQNFDSHVNKSVQY